jgi:hypothetical protein
MKSRDDIEDLEEEAVDRRRCYFCERRSPGDYHEFWAGFCLDYKENRAFLSSTVHIRAKYRDLKRYRVLVCNTCAAGMRRKRHLAGAIGWGLLFFACAIAAAVVAFTNVTGSGRPHALGVIGLFGFLGGLLAVLEVWALVSPRSSPAVTLVLMDRVKKDPKWLKKGDSFFSPEEHKVMFKNATEAPLTAEEILAMDQSGPRDSEERKPRRRKNADVRSCPHCGGTIPSYAQACSHCKKVLD